MMGKLDFYSPGYKLKISAKFAARKSMNEQKPYRLLIYLPLEFREEWSKLGTPHVSVSDIDVTQIAGSTVLYIGEIEDIYLPMIRLPQIHTALS